jgi:hypothetical protein
MQLEELEFDMIQNWHGVKVHLWVRTNNNNSTINTTNKQQLIQQTTATTNTRTNNNSSEHKATPGDQGRVAHLVFY